MYFSIVITSISSNFENIDFSLSSKELEQH